LTFSDKNESKLITFLYDQVNREDKQTKMTYFSEMEDLIIMMRNIDPIYEGQNLTIDKSLYRTFDDNNEELQIATFDNIMINYNYNLGFKLNRIKFRDVFEGKGEFYSRFNNQLNTKVMIEIKCDKPIKKKGKVSKVTFMVYRTGSVTQTGPTYEDNESAYNKFIQIVKENINVIKTEEDPNT